ncbi:MAG: ATP-binding protein [Candidatus Magasanikbacteria bacterium]|nr:ATP-binding protein [Candidatus Magasanikbacteria bacterium]
MEKVEIIAYVQRQMASTSDRLRAFTHDRSGKPYPKRYIFFKLEKHLRDFLAKLEFSPRSIIITGLRGVGKTTVLAQACANLLQKSIPSQRVLFLSLEEIVNVLDSSLTETLGAFQEIIGEKLDRTNTPVFLFLDEVQKDAHWGATLRSLYEKNKNIFIFCTGSSAVELQTNADIARRFLFEKLPPLSFGEYQMIRRKVNPVKGIKQKLVVALYLANSGLDGYNQFAQLQQSALSYLAKASRDDVDHYMKVGTMPFALSFPNEDAVYDAISLMLDSVATKDLVQFGKFEHDTLLAVKRLLFILAENDTTSIYQLERVLGISRLTIQNVLGALEKTELLIRVPAHGSNMTVAKQPAKYLFMSPAIRMSFFRITGNIQTYQTRKGKLLEDLVGAHLYREFVSRGVGTLRYDATQGGADFILQIENKR